MARVSASRQAAWFPLTALVPRLLRVARALSLRPALLLHVSVSPRLGSSVQAWVRRLLGPPNRAPRLVPPHIPLLRRRTLRFAEPDDSRCLSRERARAAVSPDWLTSLGTRHVVTRCRAPSLFVGGAACRRVHGPRPLCPLVHGWTPTSPHRGSGKQRCSERGRRDGFSTSRLHFFWINTPKWDGYII